MITDLPPAACHVTADDPADPGKAGFAEEAIPHIGAVYRFALKLARGDESLAEDLVQDTYMRAYRSWATYSRGTQCRSWLFTICRNVAVRRSESRATRMEIAGTSLGLEDGTGLSKLFAEGAHSSEDPEQAFFDELVDDEVLEALDRLPHEYRDAVILCDLQGFGYGDIATMLGVAGGTIKSRIHRGRRILQDSLHAYAVEVGHLPNR